MAFLQIRSQRDHVRRSDYYPPDHLRSSSTNLNHSTSAQQLINTVPRRYSHVTFMGRECRSNNNFTRQKRNRLASTPRYRMRPFINQPKKFSIGNISTKIIYDHYFLLSIAVPPAVILHPMHVMGFRSITFKRSMRLTDTCRPPQPQAFGHFRTEFLTHNAVLQLLHGSTILMITHRFLHHNILNWNTTLNHLPNLLRIFENFFVFFSEISEDEKV